MSGTVKTEKAYLLYDLYSIYKYICIFLCIYLPTQNALHSNDRYSHIFSLNHW